MQTVESSKNIDEGIQKLIDASIKDYNEFCDNERMREEHAQSWRIEPGRKFIKLVSKGSVHSFIVKEDMFTPGGQPRFKRGDVLKPASWKAPALNRARGNVLEGNYPIQWTGPLYLN